MFLFLDTFLLALNDDHFGWRNTIFGIDLYLFTGLRLISSKPTYEFILPYLHRCLMLIVTTVPVHEYLSAMYWKYLREAYILSLWNFVRTLLFHFLLLIRIFSLPLGQLIQPDWLFLFAFFSRRKFFSLGSIIIFIFVFFFIYTFDCQLYSI